MGVYGQAELTLSVVVERPRSARTFARQGRKRDKTTLERLAQIQIKVETEMSRGRRERDRSIDKLFVPYDRFPTIGTTDAICFFAGLCLCSVLSNSVSTTETRCRNGTPSRPLCLRIQFSDRWIRKRGCSFATVEGIQFARNLNNNPRSCGNLDIFPVWSGERRLILWWIRVEKWTIKRFIRRLMLSIRRLQKRYETCECWLS